MGMTQTPPPTRWAGAKVGGATIVSFVALLYIVELVDQLSGGTAAGTVAHVDAAVSDVQRADRHAVSTAIGMSRNRPYE